MPARKPSLCLWCAAHLSVRAPARRLASRLVPNIPVRSYTPHPSGPKPLLDIKHIIRNPGLYQQNCVARNYDASKDYPFDIADLSARRAALQKANTEKRRLNNDVKRKIERLRVTERESGRQITQNAVMTALLAQAQSLKHELAEADREADALTTRIEEMALALPNLSSTHTPEGAEPTVLSVTGDRDAILASSGARSHTDIGTSLGVLDFAAAANTSGWGWYFLKNEAAMLEQALIQYTLQTLRRRGFSIVTPPSVVYTHVAAACGFQPRDQHGEQQIYSLVQPDKDQAKPPHSLAGTAEIPLAGMYAGHTFAPDELPVQMVASSRCYRAEAGARGVDTKGLYRVHEFTKVEMFAWTRPDERGMGNLSVDASEHSFSAAAFDDMVAVQRALLDALGLAYRVLEMPTTDLGASAARKIDIEAFFPSRRAHDDGWGEVTSTSVCTDYQSRRLGARVRQRDGSLEFAHTVNGTAMAIPRVLAAVMETWWNEARQELVVPEVLRPWMDGITVVRPK